MIAAAVRIALILLLGALLLGLPRWAVGRQYAAAIFSVAEAPPRPVAIVFGAGLRRDGTPTAGLADRGRAGVGLYPRGAGVDARVCPPAWRPRGRPRTRSGREPDGRHVRAGAECVRNRACPTGHPALSPPACSRPLQRRRFAGGGRGGGSASL